MIGSTTLARNFSRDMSRHLPADRSGWTPTRYAAAGWIVSVAFVLAIAGLVLTLRLGAPLVTVMGVLVAGGCGVIVVLSWLGRTMAAPEFFFAGSNAGGASIGLSSLNEWLGGTLLLLLAMLPVRSAAPLALAIVTAVALQTVCLAPMMQRSGTVTVPGLMAWRTGAQRTGLAALPVVLVVCALLAIAEGRIVAASLAGLFDLTPETLGWGVVAMAAVPALAGGFQALVAVNLVLALAVLLALILPAAQLAFLGALPDLLPDVGQLAPLRLGDLALPVISSPVQALTAFIVVACGLAALPSAMGRVALTMSGTRAMRAGNWSMLAVFLLLASAPLVFTLLRGDSVVAGIVSDAPILSGLPRLALLLASFNALVALLHVAPCALVRALRRTQRRDPSERSMALIRLLVLASATGLGVALSWEGVSPNLSDAYAPFLLALALAAAGLFAPLVAAAWVSRISWIAYVLAMLGGPAVTVGLAVTGTATLPAGVAGLGASAAVLAISRIVPLLFRREPLDTRAALLRRPES